MSGVLVRDLNEKRLLTHSTRQIVSIFLLSALSYMLGVSWYEAARETLARIEREHTEYTHLQWLYIYTAVITIAVFALAIMIHFLTKLHVEMTLEK
jgi:hypothetical protein